MDLEALFEGAFDTEGAYNWDQGLTPEEVVDHFMLDLQRVADPNYREPEFRASSMPFCPLLFSMNSGHSEVEYTSQFYFSVGTILHELVQDSASRGSVGSATLWGDWRCTGCDIRVHACHKPKKLCKCKKPDNFSPRQRKGGRREWLYEEVTIEYKGLSGHIDTIIKVGNNGKMVPDKMSFGILKGKFKGKDYYWIVDYKTTNAKGGIVGDKHYPYRTNVIQISVYTYVMREKYGLNVVGWSLVYIDRSKPIRNLRDYKQISMPWTEKNHSWIGKKLEWACGIAPLAKQVNTRLFKNKQLPTDDQIRELVVNRPCTSEKSWMAWMAAGWERVFSDNPDDKKCANLDACMGSDSKCFKHMRRVYRELHSGVIDEELEETLAAVKQFDDAKK